MQASTLASQKRLLLLRKAWVLSEAPRTSEHCSPQLHQLRSILRSSSSRTQWRVSAATPTDNVPRVSAPVPAFSGAIKEQLQSYLSLVLEKNKVMNLTAVRDEAEAWDRHILDSAALLPILQDAASSFRSPKLRVLDVGSGAGLPGIVLALLMPLWQVTLLEATKKKCMFLEEVIADLQLGNVKVVWQRAEEAGTLASLRERHDIVVARAVAELRTLAELCLPFAKVGGIWVAAKGPNIQEEVDAARNAIGQLGGRVRRIAAVDSLSAGVPRTAVVVGKIRATPRQYPRLPGRPNKQPL
ncbi:hypothetical protein WJX84_012010 [Apatococcus fuscideae]|uniref:Ribosomal RNA small subunit methyltransferase G n=1 Tax=Apatococcus fuscideae TaxID=2026836 RepID=A0AAW1RTF7_9CHLO